MDQVCSSFFPTIRRRVIMITHTNTEKDEPHRPFSLAFFGVIIIGSLAILFVMLWLLAPSVWKIQMKATWWALLATFLSVHLFNAFAEYFFHRYVLHAPLIPFLKRFWKQHTLHHGLTHVVKRRVRREQADGVHVVHNVYPILHEDQHEASFFPWYSLCSFSLVATPLFVMLQLLLPHAPIFLAGYVAIAWSMSLYEILHAIQHWPLEKWQPLLEHRWFGRLWKQVYAFHLRHHADMKSNESISGFFGFPVADLVFGTWVNPMSMYEHGSEAVQTDFESPKPRFIGWLDRLATRSCRNPRLLGRIK